MGYGGAGYGMNFFETCLTLLNVFIKNSEFSLIKALRSCNSEDKITFLRQFSHSNLSNFLKVEIFLKQL